MLFHLFLIGFISIVGQVVLLRELSVAFYGIELIYMLSIGIWLLWTAVGAMAGRGNRIPRTWAVSSLFLLFSVLLPAETAFIRGIRFLFDAIPGTYLPFSQQIPAIMLALFPAGILLGLMFQWAARIAVAEGRTLAMAYAAESAGAVAGGAVTTLFFSTGSSEYYGHASVQFSDSPECHRREAVCRAEICRPVPVRNNSPRIMAGPGSRFPDDLLESSRTADEQGLTLQPDYGRGPGRSVCCV